MLQDFAATKSNLPYHMHPLPLPVVVTIIDIRRRNRTVVNILVRVHNPQIVCLIALNRTPRRVPRIRAIIATCIIAATVVTATIATGATVPTRGTARGMS